MRVLFGPKPSLFVIALAAAVVIPASAGPFTIVPTFNSNITSDANAVAIEGAINAAIAQIESQFLDPISVPITFQEGGGLGSSSTSVIQVSYSTFRTALAADQKSVNDGLALAQDVPLQSASPVDGQANMWLTVANGQALGLVGALLNDGTITLNTSLMNFDRNNIDPNKYDAQSVVLHEIDEVLGLGSGLNLPTNFPRLSRAQDLFRYNAPGVRSYTTSGTATSYFSIDGGTTDLADFNQNSGADYGDWLSSETAKVQDAFGTPGVVPIYGVEVQNLDVIGYDVAAIPEPGTLMLMAAGCGLLIAGNRRRTR